MNKKKNLSEKRSSPLSFYYSSYLEIVALQHRIVQLAGTLNIMGNVGICAFLWILRGSVFAGAVHDYFFGMLSVKHKGLSIHELTMANLTNFHDQPEKFPILPMMFITIACIAISGFHATQAPLMARCITN
jgi:carbon starvation protein CstA